LKERVRCAMQGGRDNVAASGSEDGSISSASGFKFNTGPVTLAKRALTGS